MNTTLNPTEPLLENNFNACVDLCQNIVRNFYPLLGLQSKAVHSLCKPVNQHPFLNEQEYTNLLIASKIYNIGLVAIPRDIVHKAMHGPEKLTPSEWFLLQKHPLKAETLYQFHGTYRPVHEIVSCSHEFWNGTGYPHGTPRENIPMPARYLALAVYYVESPLPQKETIEFIIDNSGELFFPEAVRLFLKVTEASPPPEKFSEILFAELEPQMRLANPIHTPEGLMLFPENKPIDPKSHEMLVSYNQVEPLSERIFIYRD